MRNIELVRCVRPEITGSLAFVVVAPEDQLPQLLLILVFSLDRCRQDRLNFNFLRGRGRFSDSDARGELLELLVVVGPVRVVVVPEEVELGIVRLDLHDHRLEGLAVLRHVGGGLVHHGLYVWWRNDHARLLLLCLFIALQWLLLIHHFVIL